MVIFSFLKNVTKERFFQLNVPELIMSLYDYKDKTNDPIIRKYANWAMESLEKQWDYENFLDYKFVVNGIFKNSPQFHGLGKMSTETINDVYNFISLF